MKSVKYFCRKDCPYCRKVDEYMSSLARLDPSYGMIPVERIDEAERPDIAAAYDYKQPPAFYVDGKKLHEGAATLEMVKRVLDAAMK